MADTPDKQNITKAPSAPPSADDANLVIEPVSFSRADTSDQTTRRKISPLTAVLLVTFAILFLVAWFMFSARAVQIIIDPLPDSFDLHGRLPTWQVGDRYLMQEGIYEVKAKREGYHDLGEQIEVTEDATQSFTLLMRKLPGSLHVTTIPDAEAFILVDELEKGTVPLTIDPIEPGTHQLQLISERFQTFATSVEIKGEGLAQSLEIELVPAWAIIQLASKPAGAAILVDDIELGRTPADLEIVQGNRAITIAAPGYKPWTQVLVVEAGADQQLPLVELIRADGTINVDSRPAGASVTVSGNFKGNTPLAFKLPPEKSYQLQLSKAGFESYQQEIEVLPDRDLSLNFTLKPILGVVHVEATPADAELFIDGKSYGKANQSLKLTSQEHLVEVIKPGFAPYSTRVTPRAGFEQRLKMVLMTIADAKAAEIPKTLVTAAGQQLKYVKPIALSMGASRREPGRRSNEIEKKVELTRPFYISTHEITNEQFAAFDSSHNSGMIGRILLNDPARPVVNISWEQAASYCNWLSKKEGLPPVYSRKDGKLEAISPIPMGYRLPTEAEWALVARYAGGGEPQRFPWGDAMPPTRGSGNYGDESARNLVKYYVEGYTDNYRGSAPGGTFPANKLGMYDLGGNVAEWIHDYYSAATVNKKDVLKDPSGPETGTSHVIRGASFMHGRFSQLRWTFRDYGLDGRNDLGFRIARYWEPAGDIPE